MTLAVMESRGVASQSGCISRGPATTAQSASRTRRHCNRAVEADGAPMVIMSFLLGVTQLGGRPHPNPNPLPPGEGIAFKRVTPILCSGSPAGIRKMPENDADNPYCRDGRSRQGADNVGRESRKLWGYITIGDSDQFFVGVDSFGLEAPHYTEEMQRRGTPC